MYQLCTSHLYPRPPPHHLREWVGTFHFSEHGICPALWGLAGGYNPAHSPVLHNRKSHWGKDSNVKHTAIPWHCGDSNCSAHKPGYSPPIPVGGGGRGAVDTNDWCINLKTYKFPKSRIYLLLKMQFLFHC